MIEVRGFITESGTDVFGTWLAGLKDQKARAQINLRIARMAAGNLGDWKSVGRGVFEIRIDHGPGYRVYFARIGSTIVLLLCGGNKRHQSGDVSRAFRLLAEYRKRNS